jgi:hypothetical protein
MTRYAALLCLLLPASALAQGVDEARVTMPWATFEALYKAGQAPDEKPPPSPRDWSLNRATYSGQVIDDESAVFKARLQVEIHKDEGWAVVPLLPTTVGLRGATIDGRDAPIYLDRGWYMLVTDRKGAFAVDLDFAASVYESDGSWSVAFGLAPSGGTEVSLEVPSEDPLSFDVPQAQLVQDDAPRPGLRRMTAVLPATSNLSLSWTRALPEEEELQGEPRLYAETHTLVGVGEGVLSGHSEINWTLVNQELDTFTVELPADVAVLEVSGSGIREWDVSRQGDTQSLEVQLNFEALGTYRLFVDYERPLGDGSLTTDVPRVSVPGVERVKGYVGVEARSNLELSAGEVSGATRLDVRELPPSVLGRTDQPVLLGFKVRQNDWDIPLEVAQHEDVDVLVTIADMAEATSVLTPDGRQMHRMIWYVRNNRRQFLRIDMPEGGEIWSVRVAGKSAKPARDAEGRTLIPLVRSQAAGSSLAAFSVEVVWVAPGEAPDASGQGQASLVLPTTDVPVTYLQWSVYTPSVAKVKKRNITSTLRRVDYFNRPVTPEGEYLGGAAQQAMQDTARAQAAAVDSGVEPVEVSMPVEGQPTFFEKLLVMDEPLEVGLTYKIKKAK